MNGGTVDFSGKIAIRRRGYKGRDYYLRINLRSLWRFRRNGWKGGYKCIK
jgi:hypothetical protein